MPKTIFMRWLRHIGLITLIIFILFFFAAFTITYFVLNTERGTQWALQTTHQLLPELSFTTAQGSLLQGIRAEQIRWRNASVDIEINRVQLRLRFANLLHGEIQLSTLHAETLRITPLGPSNDDAIKLPRLFLPFALSTPDFALQRLEIINDTSTFTLRDLRSDLRWRATTLTLTQTQLHWDDIALSAAGKIGFRDDYPLRIKGKLTLPQWPGAVTVHTTGDLRHLELRAQSEKPYALSAQIKLATLDKNLPLQVHADLAQPLAQTFGADRIEISKGSVDAHGDLTRIEGAMTLALHDSRYGASKLDGTALWQPEKLQTQMQWRPSTGSLQLQCDTALAKPFSTHCNGNATALTLTPWLAEQTAEISSAITLQAKWFDPQWAFALALPDLSGKLNNDAIAATLDLHTDDGALWQLQPSSLRIGPNELKGSGQVGNHNHLRLTLNARDLAHLHAQAAGSLVGDIAIEGDTTTPTVRAQLNGNHLQFEKLRATQLRLDLVLPKLGNESGRGRLDVNNLAIDKIKPFNLTFSISGVRTQQRWALNAQQHTNRAALQCTTQSDTKFEDWQFSCSELSGHVRQAINQDWRNTAALSGRAQMAKKQFELAPFCLRGGDTELCLDQMLRYADAKIQPVAAHARGISLRWIEPWLPNNFELLNDARISAQLQLKSIAPLDAQASADIPQTRWRWQTATSNETAEINAIHFDATLNEKRAFMTTSAQSPSIGRIAAQLAVNDPRGKRELDGRVAIEQFQLKGIAWMFEGLDNIAGEINGAIDISGSAAAPWLHGQLLLKDGNAQWTPLGTPFRTVHADLTFDNNSAKLGGWFALGQGGGDIDGTISWNSDGTWDGAGENWKLRLGLIAGGLSAVPLPGSTVIFSPHAELNATPNEMHLDGYVDIASAEIQLKQLPPETTDVSQDQEIIGQQSQPDAWKVFASLGLNLGDQFHLSGFGADVNLSGRLQLNKSPGDVLHMTGEVKVPRGRYRAYGQRLTVRKGSLIFYGPLDNADLNLEAVRDMSPGVTDVVGLRVIGSLKTPEAILFSEPAMSDSDIAYYLLTGRKPTTLSSGQSSYSASGALLSLGLAGSESRAGQLAQKFGISDLQLGTGESANGQSEAEISGQLGKDLYVRYGREIGQQTNSNSISFQYQLTPKLMIETISGIEDSLNLLYSFEIK